MIRLEEINEMASRHNVSAETIEKDYVICWILSSLTQSSFIKDLVFYGGTALKRIYFDDHRFSEDIDLLTQKRFTLDQILNELKILDYALKETNLKLTVNPDKILTNKSHFQFFVNYEGYSDIIGAPKEIRIDLVMDRELFGESTHQKIIHSYSDLIEQNKTLLVMSPNTILANKLGMLMDLTRNEPRDIYDIWFLLNRVKKFDFSFNKIQRILKVKYGFIPPISLLIQHLKKPFLKNQWNNRLKHQLGSLPDFDSVTQNILLHLNKIKE